jgi:deazaflavin-dependent oxidoreductase (nitroreductase family)
MQNQNNDLQDIASESFCYLTTTGRVSGQLHEIEIWFAAQNNTLYLMAGNPGSDWVKNLRKNPNVTVRIAKLNLIGTARVVENQQEEMTVRNLLADKYKEREADGSLSGWARTALPVAIDVKQGE